MIEVHTGSSKYYQRQMIGYFNIISQNYQLTKTFTYRPIDTCIEYLIRWLSPPPQPNTPLPPPEKNVTFKVVMFACTIIQFEINDLCFKDTIWKKKCSCACIKIITHACLKIILKAQIILFYYGLEWRFTRLLHIIFLKWANIKL